MDIRQSKNYASYLENTGWIVENIGGVNYFIRKFPLIGNFVKIQRPKKIEIKTIQNLAKKYRAFQILIEPDKNTDYQLLITYYRFRKASPYLPSKTLELDLTQHPDKILKNMRKNTRYSIKHARVNFVFNPELSEFRKSWKKAVGSKRHVPCLKNLNTLKNSFGGNALFLMDQDTSSGAIFLLSGKMAYYYQAFTDKIGRNNLAQYQIVWQGIVWAKKNKAQTFDFEGIYDARHPINKWAGFTYFKKGFGGKVVAYPPSLKKYYWKNII